MLFSAKLLLDTSIWHLLFVFAVFAGTGTSGTSSSGGGGGSGRPGHRKSSLALALTPEDESMDVYQVSAFFCDADYTFFSYSFSVFGHLCFVWPRASASVGHYVERNAHVCYVFDKISYHSALYDGSSRQSFFLPFSFNCFLCFFALHFAQLRFFK